MTHISVYLLNFEDEIIVSDHLFFCSHVAKMFLYLNLNEKTQLKFLEQEMNGICFSPVSFMNLFFVEVKFCAG